MKGGKKDIIDIWVEPEIQDEYKYRTLKDVSKRFSVERRQASQTTI